MVWGFWGWYWGFVQFDWGREHGPRTEGQKGGKWRKSEYFGLGAIELLGVRHVYFFIFVRFGVIDVMA